MTGDRVDLCYLAVLVCYVFPDTRTEKRRANERRNAANHMNGGRAGVVVKTDLAKPAAAPYPVRFDGIDKQRNKARINAVRGKLRPLRHSAGYDGRCRRAEHEVKNKNTCVRKSVCGGCDKFLEMGEHLHVRLAYKAEKRVFTHHQRITEQ